MNEEQAIEAGKADPVCTSSGFAVAQMSSGRFDYFPTGQPPNVNGNPDRDATVMSKWRWNTNTRRWKRVA